MDNISFEEGQNLPQAGGNVVEQSTSGLTALVQKWRLAKDTKSAQMLLLIVAGIAVLIAVVAPFVAGSGGNKIEVPEGYEIVTPPGQTPRLEKI